MDLRAIRSAKAKAQESYTSKELTLRTAAVAARKYCFKHDRSCGGTRKHLEVKLISLFMV